MKASSVVFRGILGSLLLVFGTQPMAAQDPAAQDPSGQDPPTEAARPQRPDSVALVFEREVFVYPQYERHNPFAPLSSGDDAGPRFEGLRLLGVISSSDPRASVALLGPRADQTQDPTAAQSYRVRQGDRLGNMRILQIQENRIVVEIEEFGMTEQRIMELQRPGQGGLS
jgi:hypothetical protein